MPTLEEAQTALARVEATLADWRQKQAVKARELADLQAGHARAALAGVTPEQRAKQLAALETEANAIAGVITSLEAQQQAAARAVKEAQITDCRERAAALRAEAAAIVEQRKALEQELERLEGRLYNQQPRSMLLERQAQGLERQAEYLTDQLWREDNPPPQRARPLYSAGTMSGAREARYDWHAE